ncbi:hypothetical protein [Nocardia terpenica]|uniref:Uncharacterized protein n=1 Tax=Nocardia terpenica TaxID=455432 RepID=A0A291RNZ3_9NOCA|nr:hypothetical protein [Nocardia terpenica]ATL69286.1 hypothetical protein CRH09_27035 [Nocardia terpenica]
MKNTVITQAMLAAEFIAATALVAVLLMACSSEIHATIVSHGGVTVYRKPPEPDAGAGAVPDRIIQPGSLPYRESITIICHLTKVRAYKISHHGQVGYINDDVAIVMSDGSPIHPSNAHDC